MDWQIQNFRRIKIVRANLLNMFNAKNDKRREFHPKFSFDVDGRPIMSAQSDRRESNGLSFVDKIHGTSHH